MRGQRGIRALPGRLLLAVALGALALFAIPAVGFADHGHHHGHSDPAGTVKSFDQETGVLVIDLAEGGDIEGLVNDRTRIRCRNDNADESRHNRRHGRRATASDSGPGRDGSGNGGDNSGPGNSADDNGDHHAEEPGEDNHAEGNEPGEDNHDQVDQPGEDHHGEPGDDDNDNDNEHQGRNEHCVPQLVPGAVVRRAELELEDGNAFFEKVVLMPMPQPEEKG
jgi:hypothetical protein